MSAPARLECLSKLRSAALVAVSAQVQLAGDFGVVSSPPLTAVLLFGVGS